MSKEAMKLALEALEFIPKSGSMLGTQAETKRLQAIAVMKEALVMQQISEPCRCGKQTNAWCMANTCSKAQQALDKKAENARELGLDYEPVCNKDPQGCWMVRCQLGKKCKNTPAQQKPVAYLVDGDLYYPEEIDWETLQEQGHTVAPLYTKDQL
jgi:hypothetical protein